MSGERELGLSYTNKFPESYIYKPSKRMLNLRKQREDESQVCCSWQCPMCYMWECTDTKEVYDECGDKIPVKDFWQTNKEEEDS